MDTLETTASTVNDTAVDQMHPSSLGAVRAEWSTLCRGERVELKHGTGTTHQGTVDDLTNDGSVVWVWRDSGGGRTMYVAADDVVLRRLAE